MRVTSKTVGTLFISVALLGCPESTTGPNVPPNATGGAANPMIPPKPGSGGIQYGVPDPVPGGGKQMNAQAAAFF